MTDHQLADCGTRDVTEPVGPFEPPYYSVVFTARRAEEDHGYAETSQRMDELVETLPGFLGADSAGTPGGLAITVAYFRDLDAIKAWRDDPEHRVARKRGREEWFERYVVHVGKVERSYGGQRRAGVAGGGE
ncbi:antibiotic biosynthesis monooxygenase family protein [Streptomyces spectabilis]|uniref:Antibiotic biosynthesis monooxygenase n=1 Tax=Streptomyces spectabilis TaxID=68270 RepID=A0A5P2X8X7_STRST|nr:antibiotic biosynthesis monooxygenase [Streptomyces spectabilis]MBB5104057.1 heme-degrading monooxygenase HmoA [Streptomyces spectabilis]MCI3903709.1 antibiotic biosynthesis monooxygenase [Streptomyces spectabilis]QEV60891.1 antibiotic biosynthesis monooxygenase [Streptomyces spectabilis]